MSVERASNRWRSTNLCSKCVKNQNIKCKNCSYKKRNFKSMFHACQQISVRYNIELLNLAAAKDELEYIKFCGCKKKQLRDSLRTNGPMRCQHDGVEMWRFFENKVREFLGINSDLVFFKGRRLFFDGISDSQVVEIKLNRSALMLEQGVRAWKKIFQYLEYSKEKHKDFIIFIGEEIPNEIVPNGLDKYIYGPSRWHELGLSKAKLRYLLKIDSHWIQAKSDSVKSAIELKQNLKSFLQKNDNRLPSSEQSLFNFGVPIHELYSRLGVRHKLTELEKALGVDGIKRAAKCSSEVVFKKIEPQLRTGVLPSDSECRTIYGVSHFQLQAALGFSSSKRVTIKELCKRLTKVFGLRITGTGRIHALRKYNSVKSIKFQNELSGHFIPRFKLLTKQLGFLPTPELTKKLLGIDRITIFRHLKNGASVKEIAKLLETVNLGKAGSLVGLIEYKGRLWSSRNLANELGLNNNYFGTYFMRNGPLNVAQNFRIQTFDLKYFGSLAELVGYISFNTKGHIIFLEPFLKKQFPIKIE